MFDYHLSAVAPLSHREPLAYLRAPRTVPTLVSRFTNPGPPVQNGTTPNERSIFALPKERLSGGHALSEGTHNGGAANQEV
jgi:hypothetical protein